VKHSTIESRAKTLNKTKPTFITTTREGDSQGD
jgi:hypothetical protein